MSAQPGGALVSQRRPSPHACGKAGGEARGPGPVRRAEDKQLTSHVNNGRSLAERVGSLSRRVATVVCAQGKPGARDKKEE